MRDAKQVFERYEMDLIMLAARDIPPDTLRFNVVEYVCRAPKIDPIKMGKALVDEGIEIVFDEKRRSSAYSLSKCRTRPHHTRRGKSHVRTRDVAPG